MEEKRKNKRNTQLGSLKPKNSTAGMDMITALQFYSPDLSLWVPETENRPEISSGDF